MDGKRVGGGERRNESTRQLIGRNGEKIGGDDDDDETVQGVMEHIT